MDGTANSRVARPKVSWAFMAEHMPYVVARIKATRAKGEGAHLDECWSRGVQQREPGWFWAYEAGVAVGVPDDGMLSDPVLLALLKDFSGAHVLMLRNKSAATAETSGVAHGA